MEILENSASDAWKLAVKTVLRARNDVDSDGMKRFLLSHLLVEVQAPTDVDALLEFISRTVDYPSPDELQLALFAKHPLPGIIATYGGRMAISGGHKDQLHELAIPSLKKNPSVPCTMSFHDPADESLPLHEVCIEVKEGKIDMTGIIDSCDILLGFPSVVFQLRKLQEHIARELGIPEGRILIWCREAVVVDRFLGLFGKLFSRPV
jgi:hypothetical protein